MIIEFIYNKEIEKNILNKIINLKMQHWPYDEDAQIKWMEQNLHADDIHVCVFQDEALTAYLNLVELHAVIDDKVVKAYGIGNVCVDKVYSRKGYGKMLMAAINVFLVERNIAGILLCKERLVPFYTKANWRCIDRQRVKTFIGNKLFEHCTMVFNIELPQQSMYLDRNF